MAEKTRVQFTVNGDNAEVYCAPRESLLEALRDHLYLTGTKEGCNNGNCGACTVQLNDRIVDSCLVLAVECEGDEVLTVEGLADENGLHPVQQAFLEHAALQCGVCTPGFLVASKALLDANPNPTEHELRYFLAGNLCRCTGYDKIVRAVMAAAQTLQENNHGG